MSFFVPLVAVAVVLVGLAHRDDGIVAAQEGAEPVENLTPGQRITGSVVAEIGGYTPTIFTENSTHYTYETNWGRYTFSKTLPFVFEYQNGNAKSSYSTFWLETSKVVFPLNYVVTADENTYVVSMDVRRGLKKVGTLTQTWDFNRTDKPKISVGLEKNENWDLGDFRIVWAVAGTYLNVGNEGGRSRVGCNRMLELVREDVRAELGSSESDWSEWVVADWSDEGAAELWSGRANVLGTEVAGILVKFGLNDNEIDPNIVNDSLTAVNTLVYLPQRRVIYGADLTWIFYSDDENLAYVTSSDGINWSAKTVIYQNAPDTAFSAENFSIWCDGENVHYARTSGELKSADNVYYRKGQLVSDGSINWLAAEQLAMQFTAGDNENFACPSIAVDTSGRPMIIFENMPALTGNRTFIAIRSDATDGTWSMSSDFPYTYSQWSYAVRPCAEIVPLLGDNMLIVEGGTMGSGSWKSVYLYDGANWFWDSAGNFWVYTSNKLYGKDGASAVGNGENAYIVWSNPSTIYLRERIGADNKLGTTWTVYTGTTSVAPSLSITSSGYLYIFWENDPVENHFYFRRFDIAENQFENGICDIFVSDNALNAANLFSVPYDNTAENLGIAWVMNKSSPYALMYENIPDAMPAYIPAPAVLSYPISNDNVYTRTPLFEWNDASGATSYRIELDNDADFSSPLENATVDATVNYYQLPPENAMDNSVLGVQYYWRVWGINENGETASATNMFYCRTQGDEPVWRALLDNKVMSVVVSDDGTYTAVQTLSSVYLFDNDNTSVWQFDQIQTTDNRDSLDMTWDGSCIIASGREPQSTLRKTYVWTNADNTPVWEDSSNGTSNVVYVSVSRHPTDNATYFLKAYGESGSGMIYFFDNDDNIPIWIFNTGDYSDSPLCGAVSDEGNLVAFGGTAGSLFVLSNSDNSILWSYYNSAGYVNCLDISDNSFYIAAGAGASQVDLFDNEDNHNRILLGSQFGITSQYQCKIGENDNEGWIVYASYDDTVPIYPLDNTSAITGPIWSFQTGDDVYTVDISDNDRVVVAGGADNKVYVFSEDNDNTLLWSFDIGNQIQSVDISPDNNFIVVASDDNYVYFFGAPAGAAPPPDWNQTESWTGTVTSPANWNQVESWTGTVTAPANWNQVESWSGTVTSPANWNQAETWSGSITSPVYWNQVESWSGEITQPASWQQIESWSGTVQVPAVEAVWGQVESWSGTVQVPSAEAAWSQVETWTSVIISPANWNQIDGWNGTANQTASWNQVESWSWSGTVLITSVIEAGEITFDGADYRRINNAGTMASGELNDNIWRSYTEWDISSLPDDAIITDIVFEYRCSVHKIDLHINDILENQPSVSGDQALYEDIGDGTTYSDHAGFPVVGDDQEDDFDAAANPDLQAQLALDWFAVGLQSDDETQVGKYSTVYTDSSLRVAYFVPTATAPANWNQVESWTGTVTSPANWNQVESWSGTVTAPANWNQVESWTGTVNSPASWNQVESWSGSVQTVAVWDQVETWSGTVTAPANWGQIESWTGTVTAPAAWQQVDSWSGTVTFPSAWQQIETWTGTVMVPSNWDQIETWSGDVSQPAVWQQIESWTGTVSTPAVQVWNQVETWGGEAIARAGIGQPVIYIVTINENTGILTIEWENAVNATAHRIQIDNENTFTDPYDNENSAWPDNTYTTILFDHRVYIRVRGEVGADNGEWSEVFSVNLEKDKTMPSMPSDEAGPTVMMIFLSGIIGALMGVLYLRRRNSNGSRGATADIPKIQRI